VDMAQQVSFDLQRAMEGLQASKDSLRVQQAFAKRLDEEVRQLYEDAKVAMSANEEERARILLFRRQSQMKKLKGALQLCAGEKERMGKMQENVDALEQRAMEVDALMRRSVNAKSLQDTTTRDVEESMFEDPLLRKFRDLERLD